MDYSKLHFTCLLGILIFKPQFNSWVYKDELLIYGLYNGFIICPYRYNCLSTLLQLQQAPGRGFLQATVGYQVVVK
jgi:hypothetical protein